MLRLLFDKTVSKHYFRRLKEANKNLLLLGIRISFFLVVKLKIENLEYYYTSYKL